MSSLEDILSSSFDGMPPLYPGPPTWSQGTDLSIRHKVAALGLGQMANWVSRFNHNGQRQMDLDYKQSKGKAGLCSMCSTPCTSECICGELYCSRACLRKDWYRKPENDNSDSLDYVDAPGYDCAVMKFTGKGHRGECGMVTSQQECSMTVSVLEMQARFPQAELNEIYGYPRSSNAAKGFSISKNYTGKVIKEIHTELDKRRQEIQANLAAQGHVAPQTQTQAQAPASVFTHAAKETEKEKDLKLCRVCENNGEFACSRCESAPYCSATCQKIDWKGHKKVCKKKSAVNSLC